MLAIPRKRHDKPLLGFLTREEMASVQAAPDLTTWSGRRDQALIATLYNTGARVSEVLDLCVSDFASGRDAAVLLRGKGREERLVPLWRATTRLLTSWVANRVPLPDEPLFPNRSGRRMTRSGVASRLGLAVTKATVISPSLRGRRVSPRTIRHTTAMHPLQSGVDITVIALWLGHESPTTTHHYIEADLAMKQRTLEKLTQPSLCRARFSPSDDLLTFLEQL